MSLTFFKQGSKITKSKENKKEGETVSGTERINSNWPSQHRQKQLWSVMDTSPPLSAVTMGSAVGCVVSGV